MRSSVMLRNALILGLLSAIGPAAIDMYLPALPQIGTDLKAQNGAVQMSLLAFFAGASLAQLFYGPLSDMFGRKLPLQIGLLFFSAGSLGAALTTDIDMLVLFRLLQGTGAAAAMVIPYAIVRDLHTGVEATRLISLLMLVFSISPILAPLGGSLMIDWLGWRSVFWATLAVGAAGLLLLSFFQQETRPVAQRVESSLSSALDAYRHLIRDGRFLGLTVVGGLGVATFMIYLVNSSFVLTSEYFLTTEQYAIVFSINAASFFGMSQLNGILSSHYGLEKVTLYGVVGVAVTMAALFICMVFDLRSLFVMIGFLFLGYGFLGLVFPSLAVLILADHGQIAGTASALSGTIQLFIAAVAVGLSALLPFDDLLQMIGGIALSAVLATVPAWFLMRRSICPIQGLQAEGA